MSDIIKNYLKFLVEEEILVPVAKRKDARFYVAGQQVNASKVSDLIKSPEFIFKHVPESSTPTPMEIIFECAKGENYAQIVNFELNVLREKPESMASQVAKEVLSRSKLDWGYMGQLQPYVDVRTGEVILWDEKLQAPSAVCFSAYKMMMSGEHIELMKSSGGFSPCAKIYDPYSLKVCGKSEVDGCEIFNINTYKPAEWRLKNYEPKYPKQIKVFLDHLFPIEEERNLVLTFLKHMILFRVSWIFLLLGNKGIGKGIFVDYLCRCLVGHKYFAKANKGFFESRFQDVLIANRLIFFDEINVKTTEGKNDIKRLCNKLQSIEVKGKNSEQYHIYYSVIMANNSLRDIKVESDDRRFFIPQVTEVPLKQVFSEVEINELIKSFEEDESFYGPFGNYLLELEDSPHFHPENAYITETFYEAVDMSLSDVEKFIVATVKSKEESFYPFKVLKKTYKGDQRFFSEGKIKEFIKNHNERGVSLGTIETEDNEQGIKVNPHFL